MNRTYRHTLLLLITVFVCLTLSGCHSAASQKRIVDDITSNEQFYYAYGLADIKSEITKRQTNKGDKTDFIWLIIDSENGDFSYHASYKIEYVLYNDGWKLEKYDVLEDSYFAKTEPDYASIEQALSTEYNDIQCVEKSTTLNDSIIKYSATKTEGSIINRYRIALQYQFSPSASWKEIDRSINITGTDFDIVGEWTFKDNDGRDYYIHVKNTSGTGVTLSYSFRTDNFYFDLESVDYAHINMSKSQIFTGDLIYSGEINAKNKYGYTNENCKNIVLYPTANSITNGQHGLLVDGVFLTRQNNSETPIIGREIIDEPVPGVKEPKPTTVLDTSLPNDFLNYRYLLGADASQFGINKEQVDADTSSIEIGECNLLGRKGSVSVKISDKSFEASCFYFHPYKDFSDDEQTQLETIVSKIFGETSDPDDSFYKSYEDCARYLFRAPSKLSTDTVCLIQWNLKNVLIRRYNASSSHWTREPSFGMTFDEVKESSWGQPKSINSKYLGSDNYVEWVYPNERYIYFNAGTVTMVIE